MRGRYIQSAITTGRFTFPVAILIACACALVTFFVAPIAPQENTYPLWAAIGVQHLPLWLNRLLGLLVYLSIGYLLILMNNAFGLVKIRASAQTSIYLLFVAACPPLLYLSQGNMVTLFFVLSIWLLFSAYQRLQSSKQLFYSFLLAGTGSLILPQITWLALVLLIGASVSRALNVRSFFAALMGWSVPYWFLFGHAFWYDKIELFYQPFIELTTFCPIDFTLFAHWELAMLGYTFVLFLISSIHSFVLSYKDKIRTRVHLRFFILLNFCLYLFVALQPVHCLDLLPLLLVGVSILTSHMFILTNNKASNILLISVLIGLVLLFAYNLWMLL